MQWRHIAHAQPFFINDFKVSLNLGEIARGRDVCVGYLSSCTDTEEDEEEEEEGLLFVVVFDGVLKLLLILLLLLLSVDVPRENVLPPVILPLGGIWIFVEFFDIPLFTPGFGSLFTPGTKPFVEVEFISIFWFVLRIRFLDPKGGRRVNPGNMWIPPISQTLGGRRLLLKIFSTRDNWYTLLDWCTIPSTISFITMEEKNKKING